MLQVTAAHCQRVCARACVCVRVCHIVTSVKELDPPETRKLRNVTGIMFLKKKKPDCLLEHTVQPNAVFYFKLFYIGCVNRILFFFSWELYVY